MASGLRVLYTTIADITPGSATTLTIVSADLSALPGGNGNVDNLQLYVQLLVEGWTTGGAACIRAARGLGFKRFSGTVTQLDAASLVLSADYVDASLAAASVFIDNSGNSIRGRITTVGAMENVTAWLTIFGGKQN